MPHTNNHEKLPKELNYSHCTFVHGTAVGPFQEEDVVDGSELYHRPAYPSLITAATVDLIFMNVDTGSDSKSKCQDINGGSRL